MSLRKLVKYPAREMYGFTKAYKSMAAAEQAVEKDRQQTILELCSRMNQMAESAAGMAQILQEASSLQEGEKPLLRSLTKQLKTRLAQTRTHLRACQTLAASA